MFEWSVEFMETPNHTTNVIACNSFREARRLVKALREDSTKHVFGIYFGWTYKSKKVK